jgi:prephenate dehydrogenase (NADP+)
MSELNEKDIINIGIIGFGDMGRLYARKFNEAGWKNINVCDLPEKYETLKEEFKNTGINVLRDGHQVSRISDVIFYSVEAKNIDSVVKEYGPSTKYRAVVGGQTSIKEYEIRAFEKYLPPDVDILSCHSMHGPTVTTKGQPLVIIRQRCNDEHYDLVNRILDCLQSQKVMLTYLEHDQTTADTQAVTHVAFLSMGRAWREQKQFPWESPKYTGGIENVKLLLTLRIYNNKWHVYAGLAMMNPSAMRQVHQFSKSVNELFKLMIQEKREEFVKRIKTAGEQVFSERNHQHRRILLEDDILDQFSLSIIPKDQRKPNSHLSLLAMVDCWHRLDINPYDHMICETPIFRLLLGIAEYLFRNNDLLDEAIEAALTDKYIRADDLEYCLSATIWDNIIRHKDMEHYRMQFEEVSEFFKERLSESIKASSLLIAKISENIKKI